VATIRALKMHGGVGKESLGNENVAALEKGFRNLARHVENIHRFRIPVVVAVNRFSADSSAEVRTLKELCSSIGVECIESDHWARGGRGAADLADAVVGVLEDSTSKMEFLYPDDIPLWEKVKSVATKIYGASDITGSQKLRDRFRELEAQGFGHFPVCIAKTQYSFSTDPDRKGAPENHVVPVREVRLSAGAEFIVAICGDIMTMPGLPRIPSATKIDVTESGVTTGLF
jgi:formate--tetrahydrofolate ligase